MKTTIELSNSDLRAAVLAYLQANGYPNRVLTEFGRHGFEAKMEWDQRKKWRVPVFLRFIVNHNS